MGSTKLSMRMSSSRRYDWCIVVVVVTTSLQGPLNAKHDRNREDATGTGACVVNPLSHPVAGLDCNKDHMIPAFGFPSSHSFECAFRLLGKMMAKAHIFQLG